MSKKQRNQSTRKKPAGGKRKPSNRDGSARPGTRRKKRNLPGKKTIVGFLALAGVSVAGAAAYRDHWESMNDLSVIGNGTPTVVQVHDPSCSMCRALKASTSVALREHGDNIQYRIADINSASGRAFMSKHEVRHVTLVTFSGSGSVMNKLNGVKEPEELAPYFDRLVKRHRASKSAKAE